MSNEIVRYSNQFNAQALRRFTALDLDLLMAIAARVRDKEIDEVTFTFEELRRLAHVKKNLTDKELAARIVEVNDRLLACRFRFQDDSRTVQFTLFSGLRDRLEDQETIGRGQPALLVPAQRPHVAVHALRIGRVHGLEVQLREGDVSPSEAVQADGSMEGQFGGISPFARYPRFISNFAHKQQGYQAD